MKWFVAGGYTIESASAIQSAKDFRHGFVLMECI